MSKYEKLSPDGNATIAALDELKETQEYLLGELQTISSLLNEFLDLQFTTNARAGWLSNHPEDKEIREEEEDDPEDS